jgi:hypothetical protein
MHELFPVAGGLAIGALMATIRPSLRVPVGALLSSTVAVLATVLSGEFRVSWGFLLVDGPLVILSSVAGLLVVHRLGLSFSRRSSRAE